ncbi:MAG: thiol:disulfide interchange protein DsbA/DsbL [Comamonadaceae bacterium]|nr:MAG: thiol:disulfide interchange protein DsbA/DsbL [Comamonadaceae bacterium]
MKRREFSIGAASAVTASALALSGQAANAQGRKPEEGTDYISIGKPAPTEAPAGKIEVVEFFWYSCPHCNAFEPKLEGWIKNAPKDVYIRRVPVAFRDDFVPQQRLFYVLEAMGKLDDVHRKVFNAIHVERQKIDTQDTIANWVEKQGIDKAKFLELYNSFSIQTKARRASQLQEAFKVQGVPALGIAGRFYTDGSQAGNMDKALVVTDYLLAEVRKGR